MVLWIKAFHIISVITWFAGLFYLPRLFVYHALSEDKISTGRFKIMQRKLYFGIMMPSFFISNILGLWLLYDYGWQAFSGQYWLQIKLGLVAILAIYHFYCWRLLADFAAEKNTHSHIFYRWLNEFPVLILVAIIILVVVKPI